MSTNIHSLLLTSKEKEIISNVEKDHGFNDRKLLNAIYFLHDFTLELNVIKNQHPTSSEKNNVLNELILETNKFLEIFNNRLFKNFHLDSLNELTKFYQPSDMAFIYGLEKKLNFLQIHLDYPIPDSTIKNVYVDLLKKTNELLACLKRVGIPVKTELNKKNLSLKTTRKPFMHSLKSELENLLIRCNKIKFPVKEGRAYDAITQNCILKLMSIYETETKKEIHLYVTNYSNQRYAGNFYKFIKDIFSILKILLPECSLVDRLASTAYALLSHYHQLKSSTKPNSSSILSTTY